MIEADAFAAWRMGDPVPTLGDELHLWAFRVDAASEADWARLDDAECARARRIRVQRKQVQQASARSALRVLLAAYTGGSPEGLRFEYGAHDKPFLPEGPCFNLTHSGVWALAGVMSRGELGVDVEQAERDREFLLISERFFHARERAYLMSLPESEQAEAFYRAWTRKEAYLKAWGTGLSFASSRFCIDYAPGQAGRVLESEMPGDRPQRWGFVDLRLAPDYPGAVCCDPLPPTVRCFRLER